MNTVVQRPRPRGYSGFCTIASGRSGEFTMVVKQSISRGFHDTKPVAGFALALGKGKPNLKAADVSGKKRMRPATRATAVGCGRSTQFPTDEHYLSQHDDGRV